MNLLVYEQLAGLANRIRSGTAAPTRGDFDVSSLEEHHFPLTFMSDRIHVRHPRALEATSWTPPSGKLCSTEQTAW